jgi:hypothetical protein
MRLVNNTFKMEEEEGAILISEIRPSGNAEILMPCA